MRPFPTPGNEVFITNIGDAIALIPESDPWETLFQLRARTAPATRRPLDLQIAAHALSLDEILVTNYEREFRKAKALGLKIANWA